MWILWRVGASKNNFKVAIAVSWQFALAAGNVPTARNGQKWWVAITVYTTPIGFTNLMQFKKCLDFSKSNKTRNLNFENSRAFRPARMFVFSNSYAIQNLGPKNEK